MFLKYIPKFLFHLLTDIPGLPTKILCVLLSLPMRATCPAHMVLHHGVATAFALMEYYVAYVGNWLPTFWGKNIRSIFKGQPIFGLLTDDSGQTTVLLFKGPTVLGLLDPLRWDRYVAPKRH